MDKQARCEELRDLVVSKEAGVVIGKAIGSQELSRPLEGLRAERDALKAELHNADIARAERERETLLSTMDDARRQAVQALVGKYSRDDIAAAREEVRLLLQRERLQYSYLSSALQYLAAGDRLKSLLEAATPEERDALAALQGQ